MRPKPVILFDLDNTLLHAVHSSLFSAEEIDKTIERLSRQVSDPNEYTPAREKSLRRAVQEREHLRVAPVIQFPESSYHVVLRPGARETLEALQHVADLYIFSAGKPDYIEKALSAVSLSRFFKKTFSTREENDFSFLQGRHWILVDDCHGTSKIEQILNVYVQNMDFDEGDNLVKRYVLQIPGFCYGNIGNSLLNFLPAIQLRAGLPVERVLAKNNGLLQVPQSWVETVVKAYLDTSKNNRTVALSLRDSPYWKRWSKGYEVLSAAGYLSNDQVHVYISRGDYSSTGLFIAPEHPAYLKVMRIPEIQLSNKAINSTVSHELRHLVQWLFDLFLSAAETGNALQALRLTAIAWGTDEENEPTSKRPLAGAGPRLTRSYRAQGEARLVRPDRTHRDIGPSTSDEEGTAPTETRIHADYEVEMHTRIGSALDNIPGKPLSRSVLEKQAPLQKSLDAWILKLAQEVMPAVISEKGYLRWKDTHKAKYRYALSVVYTEIATRAVKAWSTTHK